MTLWAGPVLAQRAEPKVQVSPQLPPVPSGSPAERQAWLRARIDELLNAPSLKPAKLGVAVLDVESGKILYTRGEKMPLNPASNAKLVTTAAALSLLSPEYRFKTALYADEVRGSELVGNLYIKGYGDPSLETEDLWKMVSDLYAAGIRKVSGDLVVDDTFFDASRLPPAFDQKTDDRAYRSPTGAASLNYNAIAVTIAAAPEDGGKPRVTLSPQTPYIVVDNRARTGTSGKPALNVTATEHGDQTMLTITGKIVRGSEPRTFYKRIFHPDRYLNATLGELLARRGVKVAGRQRSGEVPQKVRLLVSHVSEPLSVLIREVNKSSNNFMAEQILKTLGAETFGRPGTWQKGLDAVARFLEEMGIARGSYQMQNGSGLYDADRFTAQLVVQVLQRAYRDFRIGADYVASLAVAGADGTVTHRMEGSAAERYVRAKTGTLDGVTCLSGFAGASGRPPLAFSVLMNAVPDTSAAEARHVQDNLAELLVHFLEATP
jgi:D-alanyl-D-alanine carboxypeptidase/D-alanyl-D-alanine-endopeptidase (penicillin-binding protein 4)